MNGTTTVIDVDCHVLPILRLAHFAAQAGAVLHEVNGLTTVLPEFRATVDAHLPGINAIDPANPCEIIGAALWTAIDLLEREQAAVQASQAGAES